MLTETLTSSRELQQGAITTMDGINNEEKKISTKRSEEPAAFSWL